MLSTPKYCFLKLASIAFFTTFINSANAETWYGTAFAIGDGYTYITNHHVASDASTICFRTPNGTAARAKVINSDKSDDLAILRANVYSQPLQLGTYQDIKKGMNILTMGYPVPSIMGLESKVTEGLVNSLSGAGNDTRRIQISAPIQPGNSGGPLLDEYGNVIGVVVSRLGKRFTEITGQYADSVGYAINISRLRALIETTPTLPNYIKPSTQKSPIPKTRIVGMIEDSVMLVVASDKRETCGNEPDSEIPDFGTIPKSKAQLIKEKEEARQLAALRLERERLDKEEKERALNQKKQDEERKNKELLEKRQQEREYNIRNLASASKHWETIEISPGFYYWRLINKLNPNLGLLDYADSKDAIIEIKKYISDIEESKINHDQKIEKQLFLGRLCECAKTIKIDSATGYAIGELIGEEKQRNDELIIFNSTQGIWQSYKIAKWRGKQFSFSIPIQSKSAIAENSKIFIVQK